MHVENVQQSVPAGTVPAVEPPVRPPQPWAPPRRTLQAPPEPPLLTAEDPVEYPSEDGLPISTNPDHLEWMVRCYRELKHRFRGNRDLFIACDMLVFYKCGNDEVALAPDAFVSFGVPPGPRARYSVRREGKPPDVVLEFASPSTVEADVGKKNKFRRMGVQEYWLVDPVGGYHDPRVQDF